MRYSCTVNNLPATSFLSSLALFSICKRLLWSRMQWGRLWWTRSTSVYFLFALLLKIQEWHQVQHSFHSCHRLLKSYSFESDPKTDGESDGKSLCRMCMSQCPQGFWGDRKRCKKCYSTCMTCTGSRGDQCSSCKPGYHLDQQTKNCVTSCGDGYYLDHGK